MDETIVDALAAMPEVARVSGMVQDIVQTPENPFFFIFGYPAQSYILERYQILAGNGLDSQQAEQARGKPLLLGVAAAEALEKEPGDTLQLGDSLFRIVGIYQTGDAFEDRGAVIQLVEAQRLFNRTNTVSIIYIQLKDPGKQAQFDQRVERLWPDLLLSSTDQYASRSSMVTVMQAYVVGISGLAVLLGGVGMMNAQLMSVLERTREIGVLRAVGWSGRRVLSMILGESLLVSLSGGIAGAQETRAHPAFDGDGGMTGRLQGTIGSHGMVLRVHHPGDDQEGHKARKEVHLLEEDEVPKGTHGAEAAPLGQKPDQKTHGHNSKRDRQRNPGPPDDPAENGPAQFIRAQKVLCRRAFQRHDQVW